VIVRTDLSKQVIPQELSDLLNSTALAHMATIGPKGEPQSSPVWFGWDGEHVRVSQTKVRQKYRNLKKNPKIALSIVDPTNPYRYIEVRGTVVDFEEDPDKAFIDEMAQKYLNEPKYPWSKPGEERVILIIEPEHTATM
jgi:PPOX class probable F420-dependent enzyme